MDLLRAAQSELRAQLRCCNSPGPGECCSSAADVCTGFVSPLDEEVVGDAAPVHAAHFSHRPKREAAGGAEAASSEAAGEESSQQRLQRLIRDFAGQVAVDPGIAVQAELARSGPQGSRSWRLRMDRRLSCLEILPEAGEQGGPGVPATITVPLRLVSTIVKGESSSRCSGHAAASPEDARALIVSYPPDDELRIVFDSTPARDEALTCLNIFQMSLPGHPCSGAQGRATGRRGGC